MNNIVASLLYTGGGAVLARIAVRVDPRIIDPDHERKTWTETLVDGGVDWVKFCLALAFAGACTYVGYRIIRFPYDVIVYGLPDFGDDEDE